MKRKFDTINIVYVTLIVCVVLLILTILSTYHELKTYNGCEKIKTGETTVVYTKSGNVVFPIIMEQYYYVCPSSHPMYGKEYINKDNTGWEAK